MRRGWSAPRCSGSPSAGPAAIFFSLTRPARTRALVLFGTFASGLSLIDPSELDEEQIERAKRFIAHVMNDWGEGKALEELVPAQGDETQLGLIERLCASPGMARATLLSGGRLEVSDLLGSVAVPTLIVHAKGDLVPIQGARMMHRRIPRARPLEVDGVDHAPWFSSPDAIVGEIEELLTGSRHAPRPGRVLATVLFTDIVGSTERVAELGDARWRGLLQRHDEITRGAIGAAGGIAVKSTGDGFLATFP